IEMIVAVLGVLKAGGAFLPLDPSWPHERLAFVMTDAKLRLVLTHGTSVDAISVEHLSVADAERERVEGGADGSPAHRVAPDHLAYVIYTSGSTGSPKGVLVAHRGLTNLVTAQIGGFAITSESRVLQFASLTFDATLSEIFTTLVAGGTLVVAPADDLLPD